MYLISNAYLAPDQTVFYSVLAGRFINQATHCGSEPKSTLLRGHLHAILLGLKKIEDTFGEKFSYVDVLVADCGIAEQLQGKRSVSKLIHADDDALWQRLLDYKKRCTLKFVTSPAESEHLATIWRWSAVPPLPAELPPESVQEA